MKRYYLSKIKQVDIGFGLVWRHRLQEIPNIEWLGGQVDFDPQTSLPKSPALLVLVAAVDHAALKNDPELIPLPQVAHDMKVSSIHTATKLKCKADIVALGFTESEVDAAWNNADGFRDVLTHFGRKHNATFDPDAFDLYES